MTSFKALENMFRYIFIGNIDPLETIDLISFSNSQFTYTLQIQNNLFVLLSHAVVSMVIIMTLIYLVNMCCICLKFKSK